MFDVGAFASGLLTGLREGVEAALIVAIICSYLARTGNARHFGKIWLGVGVAVAVSLVLGAFVKRLGKQAIHLGGATQMLFGIKGRRWDNYPRSARLYNDAWVRPLPEETPAGAQKVEQGCYW